MSQQAYIIPKIDPRVFKFKRTSFTDNRSQRVQDETLSLPIIIGAKAPPEIEQGIEVYYEAHPFTRKGFPDSDILAALNYVKRNTISLILGITTWANTLPLLGFLLTPWPLKRRSLNIFLEQYCRQNSFYLFFWEYEHKFYCPFALEILYLIYSFLRAIGITPLTAYQTAETFAMFMEHDDRYRVMVQDMFDSADREALLNNPRKELKRLIGLLKEREPYAFTAKRAIVFIQLLLALLILPRFKQAFRLAIRSVNFQRLKFDEGDKFWAYRWSNYAAMGLTLEQRQERLKELLKDMPPVPFFTRKARPI